MVHGVHQEWVVIVLLLATSWSGSACSPGRVPWPSRRATDLAFALAAVPLAATVGWLAAMLPGVDDGDGADQHVSWIPTLGVELDLRLDGFAALMLVLVAGIGVLVVAYAWRYFDHGDRGPDGPTSACSACSCCSPGRWSASSSPTTCSSCTASGS